MLRSAKVPLAQGVTKTKPTRVFLGMSGGVDSSVAALLLKQQGYAVTGVYMKNWSEDLPGLQCPWAKDLADAKRVAVRLDLPFEVWDFEQDYRAKVVDYMLAEFRAGRTPNPDVMCNQEIKFKLFYERARAAGADYIATGHYAAHLTGDASSDLAARHQLTTDHVSASYTGDLLARAADENKDQTYFLYRITEEALKHTLFPLSEFKKPEVKKLAARHHLHNAYKKESMGVCFVGEVGMRDFLKAYIEETPGEIREIETAKLLGHHEGAVFYTIGQRRGLYLSGMAGEVSSGLPYYVVAKDLAQNIVYVSRNLNHPALWAEQITLSDIIWRPAMAATASSTTSNTKNRDLADLADHPETVLARLRHRGELIPATFDGQKISFKKPVRRPAAGQSAVLYDGRICLGGGIIV